MLVHQLKMTVIRIKPIKTNIIKSTIFSLLGWAVFMDELTNYMKENPDHPIFNASYEELSEVSISVIWYFRDTPELT